MTCAVILGGGSSQRMNGADKQLLPLDGVPVIIRSALAFEHSELVDGIVIVTRAGSADKIKALCSEYGVTKLMAVVIGGSTRAESAEKGAAAAGNADIIAVHDGARPLVLPAQIDNAVAAAKEFGASILAVPAKDTIKSAENGTITNTLPRQTLWLAQTPQVFEGGLYRKMLKQDRDVTDDSMLAERCGASVHIVQGSYDNIKITTPDDVAVAEALLRLRKERRNA